MGSYRKIIDQATVSSGGGTTSTQISADGYNTLKLQIDGDTNSSNLDIATNGKTAPTASFAEDSFTDKTGVDVTAEPNNSIIYKLDVEGLKTVKLDITNQHTANTTIDGYIGEAKIE